MRLSIREISKSLGINCLEDIQIEQCYVDSRFCASNGLYIALKGTKQDGHAFLEDAKAKGAVAAIVQENYQGESFGLQLIRVQDPLIALQTLAKEVLKILRPKIIGVTGSVGKTTIKEFISTLLDGSYRISKTPNSYNGQIGLPLSILNADASAQVLILEMGMSFASEMDKLVEIASPHIAVLSRIAPVHIQHFRSLEEIAYEKCKIFTSRQLEQGFIHQDTRTFKRCFGPVFNCLQEYCGKDAVYSIVQKDNTLMLVNMREKSQVMLQLPLYEQHFLENFLAAVHVARYLDVSYEDIQTRSSLIKPFNHRFEKYHFRNLHKTVMIDDSYNNNPLALKTSLYNIPRAIYPGKVMAVLGEMRELGQHSRKAHEEIALIALQKVDFLICYGQDSYPIYEVFKQYGKLAYHTMDREEIKKIAESHLQEGDVLLIKGANLNKLWEVADYLKEKIG